MGLRWVLHGNSLGRQGDQRNSFFFFFIGGGGSVEIFLLTFSLKSLTFSGVGNGNLLQYSCLENSMEHRGLYSSWGHKESDATKKL